MATSRTLDTEGQGSQGCCKEGFQPVQRCLGAVLSLGSLGGHLLCPSDLGEQYSREMLLCVCPDPWYGQGNLLAVSHPDSWAWCSESRLTDGSSCHTVGPEGQELQVACSQSWIC